MVTRMRRCPRASTLAAWTLIWSAAGEARGAPAPAIEPTSREAAAPLAAADVDAAAEDNEPAPAPAEATSSASVRDLKRVAEVATWSATRNVLRSADRRYAREGHRHRPVQVKIGGAGTLTLGGYVETYYSYNFNRPSNGLTNFRAFDNRHNALTLQNLALDAGWESHRVYGRIALQVGHAPATYYGTSEPTQAGSSGAAASDAILFRNVQQAYAGVNLSESLRHRLFLEGGIFLSPIGFESLAVRDNAHWSHSPLFFSLPFYHTGLHLGVELRQRHTLKLAVYNGWNNVVDNNREKSLALLYNFDGDRIDVGAVYFSGVERPTGAAERATMEGEPLPWRHLVNVAVAGSLRPRLSLVGDLNGGVEPTRLGAAGWVAAALSARVKVTEWLYLAARGSYFDELRARRGGELTSPIVLPNFTSARRQWLAAGTFTAEFRPAPSNVAIKLEYRHDHALQPVFFQGQVEGDGSDATPFVTNARAQDTITLGLNAWF